MTSALLLLLSLVSAAHAQYGVVSFNPVTGTMAGGTVVQVHGAGFGTFQSPQVTAVSVADLPCATFTVESDSLLFCTTESAGNPGDEDLAGPVSVFFGGNLTNTTTDDYTYVSLQPVVLSVTPNNGPLDGGQSLSIAGVNLGEYANEVVSVSLGDVPCASFQYSSPTLITCVTAETTTAGSGQVFVTTLGGGTNGGLVSAAYTYNPRPIVYSVTPTDGPTTGGITATITGANFGTVASGPDVQITFTYGIANPCTLTGWNLATQTIQCTVPNIIPETFQGPVSVVATSAAGGSSNTDVIFTYHTVPRVTSVTPSDGPIAGGTRVEVRGQMFNQEEFVEVFVQLTDENVVCQLLEFISSTTLTCTTGKSSDNDRGFVFVRNKYNITSTSSMIFSYNDPPFISSVSPDSGPVVGGTTIDIFGSMLGSGQEDIVAVTIAGVACTGIKFVSSVHLNCITGSAPMPQTGPVLVETKSTGTVDPAFQNQTRFTYNVPPHTSGVSPADGPQRGGITISIFGTNLGKSREDVLDVVIAGSSCIDTIIYFNSTALSCILPPKASSSTANKVIVSTISAGKGDEATSAVFTYNPLPVVQLVQPPMGPSGGFTLIQIYGEDLGESLDDIVDVVIAGISCRYSLIHVSSNQLTCVTPSANGFVNGSVAVHTHSGGQGVSDATYQYVPTCATSTTVSLCSQMGHCYWCASTANCLGDLDSCPMSCGGPDLSCGSVVIIALLCVLMAIVIPASAYSIIYFVNRDDDLKQSIKKFTRRYPKISGSTNNNEPLLDDDLQGNLYGGGGGGHGTSVSGGSGHSPLTPNFPPAVPPVITSSSGYDSFNFPSSTTPKEKNYVY